ncbi:hypothetical protein [Sphaerospermopsis sp. FACHB-1194]|uniref:hypothetical protein n=1 Tax=Sphaerospermopsis sp. FACHB-1194 TaxID=2692862 RepID=UPI0016801E5B|nr:hypothetical protein [Sphaerospermopsis sp. FACHB-1194]MBD2144700.1 hypothetical protein [Sphaerospermopsis sp. FACHB-1194]
MISSRFSTSPKSDRPPTSQKRSHSHTPKSDHPPTSQKRSPIPTSSTSDRTSSTSQTAIAYLPNRFYMGII